MRVGYVRVSIIKFLVRLFISGSKSKTQKDKKLRVC